MTVEFDSRSRDYLAEGAPDIGAIKQRFDAVRAEVGKVLVGQDALVERLLLALLADGHVLLEGARQIRSDFHRWLAALAHGPPAYVGVVAADRRRICPSSCRPVAMPVDARGDYGVLWA